MADLDVALAGIRALPPVSGRLGRALALVATRGREATSDETVAALQLGRNTVRASTARAVEDLHRQLLGTRP